MFTPRVIRVAHWAMYTGSWMLVIALAGWSGVHYSGTWSEANGAVQFSLVVVLLFRWTFDTRQFDGMHKIIVGPVFWSVIVMTVMGFFYVSAGWMTLLAGAAVCEIALFVLYRELRHMSPDNLSMLMKHRSKS